jgi:hypothetical protein
MRLLCAGALVVIAACNTSNTAPTASSGAPGVAGAPPSSDVAPSAACARAGCLRSATKVGDYTAAQLRPVVDPRASLENGYGIWSIEYVTGDRTSLATVAVPFGVAPPPGGFAIAGNNHGTSGIDDPCRLTGTVFGAGLAGLFGAHGMIGVATDYPGLGTPGTLPYLVSDVEGRAALDALRAARALATWQRVPISGRFTMAGLSEGGHATLAAAALHARYAPDLDIRGFAAAAPASMWFEQWRAGFVDGPLVPFQAMLVFAWWDHYGGPSPFVPAIEPVVRRAMTTQCVGANGSAGGIGAALGTTERARVFAPAFIAAYTSGAWGAYPAFGAAFAANRIGPYPQTAPLVIYQGQLDTTVYEASTRALVDALRGGGVRVDYEVVPTATHYDLAFGFVAAYEQRTDASIAWLRGVSR